MTRKWTAPPYVRAWIPPREYIAPFANLYWRQVRECAAISQPRGYAAWARIGELCNDSIEVKLMIAEIEAELRKSPTAGASNAQAE